VGPADRIAAVTPDVDHRAIRELCEQTLRRNWTEGTRDGVAYGYTRPSPGHYPWQWFWDSCFTAIVWRRFDPRRGRSELETLLAAQRADGFIGHTIFWSGPPRDLRRFTYNILSPTAGMTASIQPPLLAWAWRIAVGDPAEVPGILRQHEWLGAHRDLEGDGLIWIVQPDESGLDASPQFDAIWGRQAHSRAGFPLLVRRNRRLGYDLRRILESGGPVCCEVMTNVLYGLSRLALGQPSLTSALVDRLYDEGTGLFWPAAEPKPARRRSLTWAALSPLALPDLPQPIARRLVEEHLLDTKQFWLPVAPPSVAAGDPAFSLRDALAPRIRRYWRGPTWINAAWLLWLGLARLGYSAQAEELARRLAGAVAASGLREYYHPFSGTGMGAQSFAWSALITELTEPDPAVMAAASSPSHPPGRRSETPSPG
jgi:hypothetical protein